MKEIKKTVRPIVTFKQMQEGFSKGGNESGVPDNLAEVIAAAADDEMDQLRLRTAYEAALQELKKEQEKADQAGVASTVLVSPDHRAAALLQTYLAQKADEEGTVEELADGSREAKYDGNDIFRWIGSWFSWWKGIKDHPFSETPADDRIPNTARIAVLADWGTGLYGAPKCAQTIEGSNKPYDVLMHLGDVYYSGDEDEVRDNFLAYWPDAQKTNWENKDSVISRALNSNHEMYTGGKAYFNQTLKQFDQAASYCALHNDHWILVGLDTAYKEGKLHGDQAAWLQGLIDQAEGRKIILFSHHQPFSLFEKGHKKITDKLGNILTDKQIFAWYWGHEHRCVVFDKHEGYNLHGRCVGHSGFPYFSDKFEHQAESKPQGSENAWWRLAGKEGVPTGLVLSGPNPYLVGEEAKFGPHGYVSLEFDGPHLKEIYHDPEGTLLLEKELA
jgi:hypothetical protein